MRISNLAIAATLLSAVLLPAQAGTFTSYGTGCGGATNPCLSSNWNGAFRGNVGASANFAILFKTGATPTIVCGVQLRCKTRSGSAAKMTVGIWDRNTSNGQPGKVLASGTMDVGGSVGAYSVVFSRPLILTKSTDYFIVLDNRVGLNLPISAGTNQTHYWNGPPSWNGPFTSVPWNYRILCCGTGPVPRLSNTGLPTINKSFSIDLSNAPANAKALWAIGVARTALDLTPAGAPRCTLLTNPLAVIALTANGQGNASMNIGIPNNRALIGFQFMNQFAVVDTSANPLGLIFSNGGEAKVGT